jgi:predicted DNA-binding transcriptional regulator AlpA
LPFSGIDPGTTKRQTIMTDKRLIKTKEAAAHVGLSESQLNKLRVYGGGPEYIKLGAAVLYEIAALDAWVDSHRRRSTAA